MPSPITTLRLDHLFSRLREHEHTTLEHIDQDPLLKRRHVGELTIANAGPKLFEPVHEHQLFAKGIVYARTDEGLKLVSLPLVKMYNHQRRAISDQTTQAVLNEEEVEVHFQEKLDGTMVQLFAHDGVAYLSTRSVLEDQSCDTEHMEHVRRARALLSAQWPGALDAQILNGLTLVFEMIHPQTRQITRYGAREEMVLLSIFDRTEYCYWSTPRVRQWATGHGASFAQSMGSFSTLAGGITSIHQDLEHDLMLPEGTIISFERGGEMVHRVKVKTPSYLEAFANKLSVNFRNTALLLWENPTLHQWDVLLDHLTHERLSEEEVEVFYREHFDAFMTWFQTLKVRRDQVHKCYEACLITLDVSPEDTKLFMKALAQHARANYPDDFHLLMARARHGHLSLHRMMCYDPPVSGFCSEQNPYP